MGVLHHTHPHTPEVPVVAHQEGGVAEGVEVVDQGWVSAINHTKVCVCGSLGTWLCLLCHGLISYWPYIALVMTLIFLHCIFSLDFLSCLNACVHISCLMHSVCVPSFHVQVHSLHLSSRSSQFYERVSIGKSAALHLALLEQ